MATGSITLKTESVNYDGTRGGTYTTMYNTINWSTSGNTITFSRGGRSGGDYWTLYNSTGAADYCVRLTIEVNYGSGWSDLITKETYIPTVAQGGLNAGSASDNLVNSLGSATLSGNCQVRAVYYATYNPVPTPDYPAAFPNKSYAEASNPSGVDVNIPPSGLSLSSIVTGANSVQATVAVTAWNGGDASTRYRCLSLCTGQSTSQRKWVSVSGNTLSSAITVDNNATGSDGAAFTITPNTRYYLTMSAGNGGASTGNTSYTQVVTLPEAATVSVSSVANDSVVISYSTSADGGFYDKTIEYSLDGGTTWQTGTTITGGSASSGTFTISGLTPGTTYSIETRITTTAGSTTGATLSATTLGLKFYGSVNDESELIEKLYGPVAFLTGATMRITGDSSNMIESFDSTTFFAKVREEHPDFLFYGAINWALTDVRIIYAPSMLSGGFQMSFREPASGGVTKYHILATGDRAVLAGYGITLTSSSLPNQSLAYFGLSDFRWGKAAKKIEKLYGSVNGETKLIFVG